MAENQSAHRHVIEKAVVFAGTRDSLLGIISALTVSLTLLGLVFYAIAKGHTNAAIWIAVAEIAGLASVFVIGRKRQEKERSDRETRND
jgi:uncharacterized membrane protein